MKCPTDGETLVMADRSGVEIDYCPKCRGVWLDRGELDKIIERAAPAASAPPPAPPAYPQETRRGSGYDQQSRRDDDDDRRQGKPYKKREGFLGELFDF